MVDRTLTGEPEHVRRFWSGHEVMVVGGEADQLLSIHEGHAFLWSIGASGPAVAGVPAPCPWRRAWIRHDGTVGVSLVWEQPMRFPNFAALFAPNPEPVRLDREPSDHVVPGREIALDTISWLSLSYEGPEQPHARLPPTLTWGEGANTLAIPESLREARDATLSRDARWLMVWGYSGARRLSLLDGTISPVTSGDGLGHGCFSDHGARFVWAGLSNVTVADLRTTPFVVKEFDHLRSPTQLWCDWERPEFWGVFESGLLVRASSVDGAILNVITLSESVEPRVQAMMLRGSYEHGPGVLASRAYRTSDCENPRRRDWLPIACTIARWTHMQNPHRALCERHRPTLPRWVAEARGPELSHPLIFHVTAPRRSHG